MKQRLDETIAQSAYSSLFEDKQIKQFIEELERQGVLGIHFAPRKLRELINSLRTDDDFSKILSQSPDIDEFQKWCIVDLVSHVYHDNPNVNADELRNLSIRKVCDTPYKALVDFESGLNAFSSNFLGFIDKGIKQYSNIMSQKAKSLANYGSFGEALSINKSATKKLDYWSSLVSSAFFDLSLVPFVGPTELVDKVFALLDYDKLFGFIPVDYYFETIFDIEGYKTVFNANSARIKSITKNVPSISEIKKSTLQDFKAIIVGKALDIHKSTNISLIAKAVEDIANNSPYYACAEYIVVISCAKDSIKQQILANSYVYNNPAPNINPNTYFGKVFPN